MRKLMTGGACLLLALAASAVGARPRPPAEPVSISGAVMDADTRAPLRGARIAVAGSELSTVSGADGAYRIVAPRGSLPASPRLTATLAGYETAEAAVRITGASARADFRLHSAATNQVTEATEEFAAVGRVVASSADAAVAPQAMHAPPPGVRMRTRGEWNTEEYAYIRENRFLSPEDEPLSTLSIDVDRASYSNVRRFVSEGRRPPKDAVRIEEMINYFPYQYPEPNGAAPFSVTTEVAPAPWKPEHRLVRVGLRSRSVATDRLPPSNLVFLIDVSGSMQSPDKLPLVKQSLRLLLDQLRETDRVAIVVYAGAAGLVLPSTPGSERGRILEAIEGLEAGGSTAGGAGLRLAYEIARRNRVDGGNNRVVLASDGDFNVGVSSDAEMIRLVEERRRQGTFLTVLGFGTGNLKDRKMEQIADHGNGNYAYVDDLLEARKVLVHEMGGTLLTVAKDVKLQVEFNPARVRAYRLIGYENRLLAAEDFNDDARDAGDMGAGHTVTALYEIVPTDAESDVSVGRVDPRRYGSRGAQAAPADGAELAFVKVRYKEPDADRSRLLEHAVFDRAARPSEDLIFASAVAGFGMLLRDSEHAGGLTLNEVIRLAERGRGADPHGWRADFVRLAREYGRITSND